ncbi:hypothetical protein BHE74_00003589 [Ensete ventricosum]|nr:hypothetical protein GW17_00026950 [Ensete ventricosum]RWW87577.1 hypothetical protein BHE74_00003589 [Ensete ventricosum]RZR88612.1 hypothetical protein BHM03_00016234 [Ensete ventricosum]
MPTSGAFVASATIGVVPASATVTGVSHGHGRLCLQAATLCSLAALVGGLAVGGRPVGALAIVGRPYRWPGCSPCKGPTRNRLPPSLLHSLRKHNKNA